MGQKPTSESPTLVEDYNTPISAKITAVITNEIIIDPIQPTLFEKKKNILVPARRTVQLLSKFLPALVSSKYQMTKQDCRPKSLAAEETVTRSMLIVVIMALIQSSAYCQLRPGVPVLGSALPER